MKTIEQCEKIIIELKQKLILVENSSVEKQKELDRSKEISARLVEANLGKKRQPKSITVHREQILKLDCDLNDLERSKANIEKKLNEAKEQLNLARVYQDVIKYKNQEELFHYKIKDINDCISLISQRIEEFREKVDELRSSGYPLQILIPILKSLQGKVSIHEFFVDGQIAPPNGKDAAYLEDLRFR